VNKRVVRGRSPNDKKTCWKKGASKKKFVVEAILDFIYAQGKILIEKI